MSFSGNLYASGGGTDLTTKGDLHGFSTINDRLPVGSNGTVLTADSTATMGVSYQANASSVLTTQGDVLYRDGSGLQRLAAGTSGDFLKTQGAGANPVWASAGGSPTISTLLDLTGASSGSYRWNYQGEGGSSYQRSSGLQITDNDNDLVGKVVTKITVWARKTGSDTDASVCMFYGSGLGLTSYPQNWEGSSTIPRPQGIPAEEKFAIADWSTGGSGSGLEFNFGDNGIRAGVGSYWGVFALSGFDGCCGNIYFYQSTETGANKFDSWSYDQNDENFFDIRTNEALQWKFEGYDPDA